MAYISEPFSLNKRQICSINIAADIFVNNNFRNTEFTQVEEIKMSDDATRPNPGNVINRPREEIPDYGRDSNGLNPDVLVRRTAAILRRCYGCVG
jgi:hypothetical protein